MADIVTRSTYGERSILEKLGFEVDRDIHRLSWWLHCLRCRWWREIDHVHQAAATDGILDAAYEHYYWHQDLAERRDAFETTVMAEVDFAIEGYPEEET